MLYPHDVNEVHYLLDRAESVEELESYAEMADGWHATPVSVARAIIEDCEIVSRPCETCGTPRKSLPVIHNGSYRHFSICRTCDDFFEI